MLYGGMIESGEKMKKNSHRIIRINEELKHELAKIIRQDLKDPRVDSLTSVLAVDTTPDLKQAKIYISVLGDKEKGQATIEGLTSSTGFIRRELARRINLRNTPELAFQLDHSIEYGIKMSKLIDEVQADSDNKKGQSQEKYLEQGEKG